jgi:hypothetical protein
MSQVTINNVNVIGGSIVMPLSGVWTADLVIDQPDGSGFDAGTSVSIKSDGGLTFSGTVAAGRTGDFLDAVHVRVLGGAGGMTAQVSPKGYVQPSAFVRDVLNDIAGAGGESLSSDIDPSLLGTNLAAWNTMQQPASEALNVLLGIVAPTATWRISTEGKLLIIVDNWPSKTLDFETINHDPMQRSYLLGVDGFEITPGMDVDTLGKVTRVEHVIDTDGKSRSHVWVTVDGEEQGTLPSIAKIVHNTVAHIDYFTLYDAKVVSQSADLTTVDVQPGDTRLPGMSKVPLRPGLAGMSVQVTPGGFIRIGWDRGNPSMPYAALWQGGETPIKVILKGVTVYIGDESGANPLPTKADFDAHTHLAGTLANGGGPVTGVTGAPVAPATGTIRLKAV